MNEDTLYYINIEDTLIEDQKLFWESLGYSNLKQKHIKFVGSSNTTTIINNHFCIVVVLPLQCIIKTLDLKDYLTYFKVFNTSLKEYLVNRDCL